MAKTQKPNWRRRLDSYAVRLVLGAPRLLPYRLRCETVAWVMAWVVGPLAGYRRRIRDNLDYVLPDLPRSEVRKLMRRVPANAGRMLIESISAEEFTARLQDTQLSGPGVAALREAHAARRPIVAISGHFGNFDAVRAVLKREGHSIGAIYRPNDDPDLDAGYRAMLAGIAEPIFPRGRKGMAQMVRHLRDGNTVAILIDQYFYEGVQLSFFGKPAPTPTSAADMALKYNALLIPCYGIRRPDLGFDLVVEEPVAHSDPVTMMQALNDSLEGQIRMHMDQWLWIHRRWKPGRGTGAG